MCFESGDQRIDICWYASPSEPSYVTSVYAASPLPPTPGCDRPPPLAGRTATLKFCTNATLCPSGDTQPVVAGAPLPAPRPPPPAAPPRPAPRPRPLASFVVG